MSNFKFFAKYKKDCKTLSQVVNKFDFNNFAIELLNNDCKGNFNIFDDVLSKNTRFSFLSYCLNNVVVNKSYYDKDKMSELKLVDLLKVIFELSELECKQVQIRDFYDKENKKMHYKTVLQPSLLGLKRDWLLSKVTKNVMCIEMHNSNIEDAILVS